MQAICLECKEIFHGTKVEIMRWAIDHRRKLKSSNHAMFLCKSMNDNFYIDICSAAM